MVRCVRPFLVLTSLIGIAAACSDRYAPAANASVQRGVWGSSRASLAIADTGATLQILSFGTCYGSYGQVKQPLATGRFDLPGTYTQLIGAYPGKLEYAARYSGTVTGNQLSITVSVPTLQTTFGPFVLVYGLTSAWSPCLFP